MQQWPPLFRKTLTLKYYNLGLNPGLVISNPACSTLTLAAVATLAASACLLFLHTLVLRLAYKPPRLAALVGVLACGALAALVICLVGAAAAAALVCIQAQHGAKAEGSSLLALTLFPALLPGLATLLPLGDACGLLILYLQQ